MKELYIIGAGGLGREVAEIVHAINEQSPKYRIAGFIDDTKTLWGTVLNDLPVLGGREFLKQNAGADKSCVVIAIADAKVKQALVDDLDGYVEWESITHPTATVSKYSRIGCGSVLQAYVWVSPNVCIGNYCFVNTKSGLGHDAVLEDFVSVMAFCDVTGGVHVEKGAYLATSVAVIPNIRIGEYAYIGAGSVVIRDIKANAVMVGNPARQIR
ncbi:MAG: acetyltransferase [Clostridiales Family XIII bacterium]|jgi:sugar O-acyltransferase (sialic acid O-acetyltransferase NeuD family)|nr:acetyltransferase [Clostridiales Family XIII bacterium]